MTRVDANIHDLVANINAGLKTRAVLESPLKRAGAKTVGEHAPVLPFLLPYLPDRRVIHDT